MRRYVVGLMLGVTGLAAPWTALVAQGPVPYDTSANWESYPGGVATGGGFVDMDLDGDLDLVVANGNDILRQRVEVFYNDGDGNFPEDPQWESGDVDYHGHLTIGDVDSDGWPDVAVSVFLGPSGFNAPGHVKLYQNDGAGTLSDLPVWRSSDSFYTFSCAFGDADGDGDLDLAVATGEPYNNPPDRNRIYFNEAGAFATEPGWMAAAPDHALDVTFGDPDGDGDLDLAFTLTEGSNEIYYQTPGGIETTPGWVATDSFSQFGNTLAFRDVDGDGWLELGVSDNNQLPGGAGVFKVYQNLGGVLATVPTWETNFGFTSAIAFADFHLDGFPDVATGVWFSGSRVFLNDGGLLSPTPDWSGQAPSVVEAIFFGDLDGDGLRLATAEEHPGDGLRRVFYLGHPPVRAVDSVVADGIELDRSSWSWEIQDGWLALDRAPTSEVVVRYAYSDALDIGVTNWDTNRGTYVFERHPLVAVAATPPADLQIARGEPFDFSFRLSSTTNRNEPIDIILAARPNGQSLRTLDQRSGALSPFQIQSLGYDLTVPANLQLGFYQIIGAVFEEGVLVDQASFEIEIVP